VFIPCLPLLEHLSIKNGLWMVDHVPLSRAVRPVRPVRPPLTIGSRMRSKRCVHSLSAVSGIFVSQNGLWIDVESRARIGGCFTFLSSNGQ